MSSRTQSLGSHDRGAAAGAHAGPRTRGLDRQPPLPRREFASASVACCLSPELLQRFRARVPTAVVAHHPDELLELAITQGVRLVVADPHLAEGRCVQSLIKLREACPTTLIVVYTSLRASVMSDVVELARHGVHDIVIYGTDDTSARFGELLERGAAAPLTSAVLRLLESNLGQMRPALADAIGEMFDSPRKLASVHQLAAAAGTTRRSLYRHLTAAGIESPRLLVVAARIVRAAQMLAHSRMSIRDIARSLGFSKPDIMTLQFVSLTGLRPRQLKDPDRLSALPHIIAGRLISVGDTTGSHVTALPQGIRALGQSRRRQL